MALERGPFSSIDQQRYFMKNILVLIFATVLFVSCATKTEIEKSYKTFSRLKKKKADLELAKQLSSIGFTFLKSKNIEEVKLSKPVKKYLASVVDSLAVNNELLLKQSLKHHFFVIKNKTPFYFSLPNSMYFFSSGLIAKYIDNEEIFYALMATQVLKSHNNIFEKSKVIPVGYFDVTKVLNLVRMDLENRSELLEWSFIALKRSGHDPYALLSWIQIKNKNILDFSMQSSDLQRGVKEEFLLKNFIVAQGQKYKNDDYINREHSTLFYKFINEIKKKVQ
jgi:hypothetical protein